MESSVLCVTESTAAGGMHLLQRRYVQLLCSKHSQIQIHSRVQIQTKTIIQMHLLQRRYAQLLLWSKHWFGNTNTNTNTCGQQIKTILTANVHTQVLCSKVYCQKSIQIRLWQLKRRQGCSISKTQMENIQNFEHK